MHLKNILKPFLPLLVILVLHETSAASIKDQLDHPNDEKAANETKITQTENQCISKRSITLDSENILHTLLPYDLMAYVVRISFVVFTISHFGRMIWNCFNWCISKFKKLSEKQKSIDEIKKQENERFAVNTNIKNGLILALYFLLMLALNKDLCITDWSKQDTTQSEFLVGRFPSKIKILKLVVIVFLSYTLLFLHSMKKSRKSTFLP